VVSFPVCATRVNRFWLLVLLLVLLPGRSRADGRAAAGDEPEAYRALIATAVEEFDLSHYSEAREQFVRAHAVFPNARSLRGMGLCDFELRRYVDAVGYLKAALASNVKRLDGQLRSTTEAILERAQGYVGRVRLRIQPADATVVIDGVRIELSAASDLLIEVGDHSLLVRAAGHASERRQLRVRGQQDEAIEIQLAPVELSPEQVAVEGSAQTSSAPSAPAPAPQSPKTPVYKRWWLWTVVGVVVAGAAAGTAIALTSDKSARQEPTPGPNTPAGVSLQALGVSQ
jgi:tetratricopeptide (TPR) repeat protein